MKFTRKQLMELEKAGKIKGWKENAPLIDKRSPHKITVPMPPAPAVSWMDWNLQYFCNQNCFVFEKEYSFHETRRWRFDFFVKMPFCEIGIEFEGIFSDHSRHTNKMGYSRDTEKYRAAAMKGIRVLRYTAVNYKNLISDLNQIINVNNGKQEYKKPIH